MPDHAEAIYRQLEARAHEEIAAEGLDPKAATFSRELDMRYTGQGYELRTPLDGLFEGALDARAMAAARDRFDLRHAQIHGHAAKEQPVEVVSYRLRLRVAVPKYAQGKHEAPTSPRSVEEARKGMRMIYFDGATASSANIYERDKLDVGTMVHGPAVVEQFDATTIVPPGWTGRVDQHRNLVLEKGA